MYDIIQSMEVRSAAAYLNKSTRPVQLEIDNVLNVNKYIFLLAKLLPYYFTKIFVGIIAFSVIQSKISKRVD